MKLTVKKKVVLGIIIFIVLGGVGVSAKIKSAGEKPLHVNVSKVEEKGIQSVLSLKAPLEGDESIEIVSRLHYEILSINVKEGDKVEEGQVLAVLDTSRLEEEIEKLRDNLELLEIQNSEQKSGKELSLISAEEKLKEELENSQRSYESALEGYKKAESEYEKSKVLYASEIISTQELKDKENSLNEAKRKIEAFNVVDGKVQATQAQLVEIRNIKTSSSNESGAKSVEIAKKELIRKQQEIDDCYIKSSIKGTVTRVNSKVGRFADEIDDKKPMFEIENMEKLKMIANVSEYDIARLQIGQKAEISADILNGDFVRGVVSRISPTGEIKSGTSNERVIPVQIDITDETKGLIAGINASAKVETESQENALVIPIEALVDEGNDEYSVFVAENGFVKKISVKVGVEDILEVQIIGDGIKAGDSVILNPDFMIEDGMSVIVNE